MASCIWLKGFLAPGSAKDIDQSSPKIVCHFFTLILFCVEGIEAKILPRRWTFAKALDSMLWKLDGHFHFVDDPTQDSFASFPTTVTFTQLLYQDRVGAIWIIMTIQGAKDLTNCLHEDILHSMAGIISLSYSNEVIHKNVNTI